MSRDINLYFVNRDDESGLYRVHSMLNGPTDETAGSFDEACNIANALNRAMSLQVSELEAIHAVVASVAERLREITHSEVSALNSLQQAASEHAENLRDVLAGAALTVA